jgi:polyisoprenoid-binding protein YceI
MSTATAPTTRTVDGQELPPAGTYQLDAGHSHVGFVVRHLVVAKTRGRFGQFHGSVVIADDPTDSSVEVEIEMASVDTRDEQRDGHLRSADFFDVEQYPTMTYRSTGVTPAGNGKWTVDGDLTVHGVTLPVPLDVRFEGGIADPWGNARAAFSATAEIDREAFGLTYNQVLEGGGVVVGKKVTIEIEAEAVRQV